MWRTVTLFSRMEPELAREGYKLGRDARDWKVTLAQKDLLDSGPTREKIAPILYRPFDVRYTYYTGRSRGFICMPRPEIMHHMLRDNVALITSRMTKGESFRHAQVSNKLVEKISMSPRTSNNAFVFPLYFYPGPDQQEMFSMLESSGRRPNLNPKVVAALAAAYGRQPTPEEIFHYVYAVLYAPTYREKYAPFLRMDFPRIPFPADRESFLALSGLGERLTALHLLNSPELDPPAARFEGEGDARVVKSKSQGLRYDAAAERVYINPTQYFAPVPAMVWEYRIGGYQVCHKWLKDRHERRLELEDIRTYCRMVTALKHTIEIQRQIDALYPEAETQTISL